MRVLAFTGLPGSGKSVAVDAVRARGIPVVRMGEFVLEEVRHRGLTITEEHIGPVASGMRKEHGDDVWAKRTVEALQDGRIPGVNAGTRLIAVDGIRSLAEVDRFKRELGHEFVLIAVEAPEHDRHERILGRGRHDDAADRALVKVRDRREAAWGVETAIARADFRITNDGDMETFVARITELLDRLL